MRSVHFHLLNAVCSFSFAECSLQFLSVSWVSAELGTAWHGLTQLDSFHMLTYCSYCCCCCFLQCCCRFFRFTLCFTSTQTIKRVSDGEPWTATSTSTQLLGLGLLLMLLLQLLLCASALCFLPVCMHTCNNAHVFMRGSITLCLRVSVIYVPVHYRVGPKRFLKKGGGLSLIHI